MDVTTSAIQSGQPRGPVPLASNRSALVSWPISVQLALGLIVVAGLFFILGRWSTESAKPQIDVFEHAGPALDLNRATRAELRLLPGLGDALAERVVDFRTRHGAFKHVGTCARSPALAQRRSIVFDLSSSSPRRNRWFPWMTANT